MVPFTPFLSKSFDDVTIEEVENYFNDVHEESNRIEYKSFSPGGNIEGKLKPIISSICAFLNSEGGILIWGAPYGSNHPEGNGKIFTGQLTYVDEYIEKDKLINKISDSIYPMPVNIKVRILENSNRYIYLFNIQPSNIKPHQFENKYLIRLDGQTRPAPHYYIEALFKQIKYPQVEGYIKPNEVLVHHDGIEFRFDTFIFNWSPLQNEKNVTIALYTSLGAFKGWNDPIFNKYHVYGSNGHVSITRKLDDILFYGSPFCDSHSLIFRNLDWATGNELELILRFGGESSPQKESHYKIRFELVDKNIIHPNILEIVENKLVDETYAEMSSNKGEILRKILGRD